CRQSAKVRAPVSGRGSRGRLLKLQPSRPEERIADESAQARSAEVAQDRPFTSENAEFWCHTCIPQALSYIV
ncbi:hypothetical protein, partial [Mycobacterium sp.]|uniref:hypothetical protein n=1 Tax=Mycobacterium sp. TaxID=1785 RepID=UPI003BB19B78